MEFPEGRGVHFVRPILENPEGRGVIGKIPSVGGGVWIFSRTTHCGLIIIIIIIIITLIIAIIITIIIIVLRYLPVSTSLEAKRNH